MLIRHCFFYLLFGIVTLPVAVARAQEDSTSPSTATTTADAEIAVDQLQVQLRALTKDELASEEAGWMQLLQAKIREVGDTEIQIKQLAEQAESEEPSPNTEEADALKTKLVELRKEELALVERSKAVLHALEIKGGDVKESQQYIDSVSDLGETTDATSLRAAVVATVTNWIKADDGGKFWAQRIGWAIGILAVFWMMSKVAGKLAAKALSRHPRASQLLENFARKTSGGVVFVVGILMALSVLGVEIGPMMAALGAGGFIVGFALQETLGSFASGMMIMIYRPFDVDDYVSMAGVEGKVQEMSLVSTTLLTVDNKVVIIPNTKAWGDTITNFTGKDIRRVDMVFGIGYEDDVRRAIALLHEITRDHELILDEPTTTVAIDGLGASSVDLFCRPWAKTEDYWQVRGEVTHRVKERFDAEGISFPFPQRDIHMVPAPAESHA